MATSDNEIAIGIDLGTTYSCVAVLRYDTVEILTNDQGQRTTPSCVAFNDKERFIGMAAQNQAATNPTNTVFDAKRLIGRRFCDPSVQNDMKVWPFKVIEGSGGKPLIVVNYKGEQKQYEPEMISSMVLLKLKETAEAVLGRKVKKAVVTVPAYFNDSQRQATKDAGSLADLNVIRIINEPTAAAFAYGFNESRGSSRPKNILIFDLGGGTFDVSILSMEGGKLVVKATNGNTHLGGQDFNNRMFEYCIREFQRMFKKDISCNQKAKARLRPCCERAKRALSTSLNTSIEVDALYDNIDFSLNISRAKFEDLNIDLFKQCLEPLRTCLEDARMDKKSIDDVVIVGGSTRIPKVQELLMEFFDKKILSKKINLDEAVAYGAAIQAAKLSVGSSNPNLQAMRLVDITPLSMGIEVEGDVMSVIIPRNTTIPMKKEETYSTCCDNQTIVSIKILEGERARTEDNNSLGEFKLSGIAPAPRGQAKVLVCFEINDNGILNVSAVELSTGNRNQITVTNNKNRLTKQEIERLLKEAERFKADDKEVRRKVEAKHRLESYVYDMKASTRLGYTAKNAIEEIIEWLQDSHLDKVEIYEGKLTYLKNICQ